MSLSGEKEEGTTASKMSLSGETEERTTASKMTQDTSSKSVQTPRAESPTTSLLSMKSDQPPAFSQEPLPDDNKEVESLDSEDALKITHNLLDRRSQTLLTVQQDIKAKLKHKYQHISEGIGDHGNQTLFKDIYTELYITEGGSGGLNNEHEVRQIEMASKKRPTQETQIKCNDIFKPLPGQDKPIRTVLTKGIAGVGKTVSVQKVILDWAEGKANQGVHFMFPLPFRDLNLKKDQYSLMQLLSQYFPELKEIDSIEDGETKTVLIFDGLDECRLPLDFKNNEKCCDVTKPTSVDVLLTNLIKGNLLPSALLWITTRPAAANQIPPECVDQMTEVRGFNDPQKKEYFRKKITDQILANEIIKHMKTSRSLHIMCHMPVFCWISATVLEMMLKEAEKDEVPKTLTQMYSHFILIQIIAKNKKYNKATETNTKELSQSDKEMILKLSKLAFQQLQKGNLIFYEEDLRDCGLDVTEASEYSALCTEIFKEESGLYQDTVYSFVHLSIQEFLAAVHALESCLDKKENVFSPTSDDEEKESIQLSDIHRRAVDQALKSENGHLDLFLRFLLGLSLESNQNLLQGLLTQTGSTTQTNEETVERTVRYLSDNIKEESSPERIINLFHCLNELGANSLVEDMQTSLRSGTLSETRLKPHQCSALAYLLLMSEEVLEEFDLKTYNTSEEGYQRLLPVVKTCKRALLDRCKVTYKSCETLASALQTPNSPLRELDLSYNDLGDRGVELLCVGLTSPLCNIQTLVLADCYLTYKSCEILTSSLQTPNSPLRELDLSYNDLEDRGVELLCVGLTSPLCNIQTLVLVDCTITYESCETLASALQTPNSPLRELDLSYNDLGDRGVELLCVGLTSPLCNIQTLVLGQCGLTEGCCSDLSSVLSSLNSQLKQLELRDNDLQDSGVTLLSAGLEDPDCKLHTLGLSGCLVTEEGCAVLSSALRSNLSHLKELDLSYNHPGDSAGGLLSAALVDPTYKLMKLNVDHGVECRLKSGPRKYACHLTLDPNTANPYLILSEGNRKVTLVEEKQHYEDHPDRLDHPQVLCREGLSGGRYYWEVERDGDGAFIGVAYKGMKRKGREDDRRIGHNKESWCLVYYDSGYNFYHNGVIRYSRPDTFPVSKRVGVYLDWPAGTLSFYSVSSSGTVTHFYTEHTTFTEPLYPGFIMYSSDYTSLTLCPIDDQHIQSRDHGGESWIRPGPEDTRDHGGESCIKPGPEDTRDHGGESWIRPGPEDTRDHGGESWIRPGPEDTRDHGGESCIKPGPEDTRDHGGESWIRPGPEDTRDHGGESWIKPGPEDTRDHGGESWIHPGPEDTRDHGGESWIKPGPENTRDHGGESCIKSGPEKWIPQSCKTCDHVEDSTHWLQIEPLTSTVQGVTMFRHRTPKGSYECTVSGLRWLCERDVILKYHFRNWEPYSQLLKGMQYTQGGPLLDITMELGELEEVHLPHFVCLGTNPSLRNEMKILHVEEHGVSLEEVHEVTRFHAKILHPKFSAISLILRLLSWNVDVHCELMLYLTVIKDKLIPRLYLFPSDPGQIQAVEQQEIKFQGSKRFPNTRPERSFKLKSSFRLNIPCSTSINPPRIHLIHRDTTPSFFRAVVKMTGIDIAMELFGDDETTAWKEIVPTDEYISDTRSTSAVLGAGRPPERSLTGSTKLQLRSVRTEFVKRVSRPVLNELLDGLLQHTVINQEEMESVKVIAERAEKARDIIDMVLRKGTESCSRMINLLREIDPYLWSMLQINSVGVPT
ncbi:NACHT, LRR and PYD domains-containing protein 5-like isoform X2 [Oncorhynchus kisutch]|uniref:NACHT, LRR and PYD domains-containing protein 5-like isoform X2 n=1 Tax=Oncorhynchus kisutch TaxID=8019 RepID=UPI0012DD733C|nr:NACHT, LRR and PYD domains-containing protein 5-like isoform X2 [Oncorhynchus kisutch]